MTASEKVKAEYMRWRSSGILDNQLCDELLGIENDEDKILDRFWRHLTFGTGGLRGIIGAGTNRMKVNSPQGNTRFGRLYQG